MDKKFADTMIAQFQKKFFGFALSKCNDMTEAEELAARITCEAYVTLRTVEGVYNWEGYLHKIASNVYARYVQEQMKHKSGDISDIEVQSEDDFESDFIKKEELDLLKREVAWLGKRHREIVLLHYYHNKKLAEIAEILELPEGTVKWHLSDAKKLLKEGMRQPRSTGNLGMEPIKLAHLGHVGSPGQMGDTGDILNSKLRQNIAYAAYFEPKTIEEIAKELNVSPVYVEDEVSYLEEWGFLNLVPGQRYQTNVFIQCTPYEVELQRRTLDEEVAKWVCDVYVPLIVELARKYERNRIYVPEDDLNYFLWSLIPMAVIQYSMGELAWDELKANNYMVKRKDGGDYVATATLYLEDVEDILKKEHLSGPQLAGNSDVPVFAWGLSTDFQERSFDWEDNSLNDYKAFDMYLRGNLPKVEAVLDKYIRLYGRGLLNQEDDSINVIVVKEEGEKGLFTQIEEYGETDIGKIDFAGYLRKYMPEMPKEVFDKIDEICEKRILLEKPYFPKHMHKALAVMRKSRKINVVMVIEELIKRGTLKPLTDAQKKGVMVVVYSDVLPNEK
ncbi:MAG: sigma-70 family RNA polymerase sigma factor [Roseburia sp.]|nr:sigma-70 family RNA polymerase sigma factor [Roseburia sp.]